MPRYSWRMWPDMTRDWPDITRVSGKGAPHWGWVQKGVSVSFVFSADGHLVEPSDLFSAGLPPSLRDHGLRAEKRGDFVYSLAGDKVLSRVPIQRDAPRLGPDR